MPSGINQLTYWYITHHRRRIYRHTSPVYLQAFRLISFGMNAGVLNAHRNDRSVSEYVKSVLSLYVKRKWPSHCLIKKYQLLVLDAVLLSSLIKYYPDLPSSNLLDFVCLLHVPRPLKDGHGTYIQRKVGIIVLTI